MAKLFFNYSTMNAGKSTIFLQAAHNYEERGRIKGKIKDDKTYLDELRYKKKAQKPKFVSQW